MPWTQSWNDFFLNYRMMRGWNSMNRLDWILGIRNIICIVMCMAPSPGLPRWWSCFGDLNFPLWREGSYSPCGGFLRILGLGISIVFFAGVNLRIDGLLLMARCCIVARKPGAWDVIFHPFSLVRERVEKANIFWYLIRLISQYAILGIFND